MHSHSVLVVATRRGASPGTIDDRIVFLTIKLCIYLGIVA